MCKGSGVGCEEQGSGVSAGSKGVTSQKDNRSLPVCSAVPLSLSFSPFLSPSFIIIVVIIFFGKNSWRIMRSSSLIRDVVDREE